jgi:hypothetical protein
MKEFRKELFYTIAGVFLIAITLLVGQWTFQKNYDSFLSSLIGSEIGYLLIFATRLVPKYRKIKREEIAQQQNKPK